MTRKEFVKRIKQTVRDSSFEETISTVSNPPGRSPRRELVELSAWYRSLNDSDRRLVNTFGKKMLDAGIFGFFCVLDGVRVIEDGARGELVLLYRNNNADLRLNDGGAEDLHDLFISEVHESR